MRTTKRFSKDIEKTLDVKDQYSLIASKLDFEEECETKKGNNLFMKKGILVLTAVCAVAVIGGSVGGYFAAKGANTKKAKPVAYVTMDVNPSLSFTVDKNNKVVTVNGENDEGKMIIYGEKFEGKDINEAIKLAITIENETGYLVSGNASIDQNNITFSITADNDNIKNTIQTKIDKSVEKVCDELNINEKVQYAEAYSHEKMVELAMRCDPTLDEETAKNMTNSQLVAIISLYHVETAEIYTVEMEELYNQAKNYEIQLAESTLTVEAINSLGTLYQALGTLYQSGIDSLQSAITYLNDTRYNLFISEESDYQKQLAEFKQDKEEVLKLRNEIAGLESDSIEIAALKAELSIKETILDTIISTMESTKDSAMVSIDASTQAIQTAIDTLNSLIENAPGKDQVEAKLTSEAKNIDAKLNETKNNFFKSFEEEYSDDITKAKNDVSAYKESLKSTIAGNNQ